MNRARVLVLAFAALAVGGCADNILKERPVTRTVKTAATNKIAFSVSSRGQSTVCGSYQRRLAQIKRAELKASAGQQLNELKARELSLNAVIADACE
jgi:hypothetical protein